MNTANDMAAWVRLSGVKLGMPGAILPSLRSEVSRWRAAAVQEFNGAVTRHEVDGVVAYKRSSYAEDWQVIVTALAQIQAGPAERRAEWVARLQEQLSLMTETLPAETRLAGGSAKKGPGRPTKAKSEANRATFLQHVDNHPTLIDQPDQLAEMIGVNVKTVRGWIKERQKKLTKPQRDVDGK